MAPGACWSSWVTGVTGAGHAGSAGDDGAEGALVLLVAGGGHWRAGRGRRTGAGVDGLTGAEPLPTRASRLDLHFEA